MNNLKQQLHEKSLADSSEAGNQSKRQSKGQVDVSKKKNQKKSSQEDSLVVKGMPYTPGVVLKFKCQSHGMTKKELRVRKNAAVLDFVSLNTIGIYFFKLRLLQN